MRSSQHGRGSRVKEIPDNYICNWQSAGINGPKPLVRRPMTACEACRNAKVKCNGQQDCDRCRNRSLHCQYATPCGSDTADQAKRRKRSRPAGESWSHTPQTSPDDTSMEFYRASPPLEASQGSVAEWTGDINTDFGAEFSFGTNLAPPAFDAIDYAAPTGVDILQPTVTAAPPLLLQALTESNDQTRNPAARPSVQDPLLSNSLLLADCQCRTKIILSIPRVESVLREIPTPRLDEVFKVTRDVIISCRSMIECTECEVRCTDLICLAAVFQQTQLCFEHTVKENLSSPIKVGVGEYEISISSDVSLRRMLIMDLVRQGDSVLDSIGALGQKIFNAQTLPNPLCQVNFGYLQDVIRSFRAYLRSITDESDSDISEGVEVIEESR